MSIRGQDLLALIGAFFGAVGGCSGASYYGIIAGLFGLVLGTILGGLSGYIWWDFTGWSLDVILRFFKKYEYLRALICFVGVFFFFGAYFAMILVAWKFLLTLREVN